jgi:hypothetical protein
MPWMRALQGCREVSERGEKEFVLLPLLLRPVFAFLHLDLSTSSSSSSSSSSVFFFVFFVAQFC